MYHLDRHGDVTGNNYIPDIQMRMITTDQKIYININTDAEITVPPPDHPMDLVEDLQLVPTV